TAPAHARTASWLSALTDPVAGPALAVLHTQPGRDWTIPSLAAAIGVSRATLARRFPPQGGCPPAASLPRRRLDLAPVRLPDTDQPVSATARSVGYPTESAFTRAFPRARHVPPGRYRTHSRATRPHNPHPAERNQLTGRRSRAQIKPLRGQLRNA